MGYVVSCTFTLDSWSTNKVVVLLNWIWNYLTYDQSLRMIVYAKKAKEVRERVALEAKTHLGNDILHPDNK